MTEGLGAPLLGQGGVMQATCELRAEQVPAASDWARQQTDGWGVPPSHVAHWLSTAGRMLPPTASASVELSYDPAMGLLSLDVWHEGTRVFGMDDWVS